LAPKEELLDGKFPGTDTAMRESIKRRLSTSRFKGAKRGTYTVRVAYIIAKDGNIADVECIKEPGYGMGAESVRAVKASSRWVIPERGIPVKPAKSSSSAPAANK